jgi:hypothetical protein
MSSTDIFQPPHFTLWTVVYTALGATFFWGRNGRTKLKVYVLSWVFDAFDIPDGKWRQLAEFIIFIVFACLVGIGVTGPTTVMQAITAGFAWTGVVGKRA